VKPKPLIVQARIESGELKVPSRKFLLAALKGWPDCAVDLEIRPFEETRRARANRYYFGVVLKMMSADSGYTKDELHDLFKLRHNSVEMTDPITGEIVRVGKSTAKLKIKPFSDYLEAVMLDGAEQWGMTFPEPRSSEEYREGAA
jgi:hypothetical protein